MNTNYNRKKTLEGMLTFFNQKKGKRSLKLASVDMNSNKEDGDEGKEDDGVCQY